MNPTIDELLEALQVSWCEETSQCGEGVWSEDNPARGQCAVSSVIIQDYLGGKLVRGVVEDDYIEGCSHYWNQLDNGVWVDSTQAQFEGTLNITDIKYRSPNYVLKSLDTLKRYQLLKSRVVNYLAHKQYEREQTVKQFLESQEYELAVG